jgi:hypothetical protein
MIGHQLRIIWQLILLPLLYSVSEHLLAPAMHSLSTTAAFADMHTAAFILMTVQGIRCASRSVFACRITEAMVSVISAECGQNG